jgi:hypothetical protein
MPTRYWLMKCEPTAYTIDDLAHDWRWCMNRNWPATIPAHAGHLPMAYDAGLPRYVI